MTCDNLVAASLVAQHRYWFVQGCYIDRTDLTVTIRFKIPSHLFVQVFLVKAVND